MASACSWSRAAWALTALATSSAPLTSLMPSVISFGRLAMTISRSLAVSEFSDTFGSGDSAEAARRLRAPADLVPSSPPVATARRVRVAPGTMRAGWIATAPLPC